MLEMKVFRESPQLIFEDLEKRNMPIEIAKTVIDLDNRWRKLIDKGNNLRAKRNSISKEISDAKKKGDDFSNILSQMSDLKKELLENEKETEETLKLRDSRRMVVPNILESEVPVGKDEEDNVEKKLYGKKIEKDNWFSHQDILEKINGADLKRASKISGRRFYFSYW